MSDLHKIKELNEEVLKKVNGGVTKVSESDIGRKVHVSYSIMNSISVDYYGTLVAKGFLCWVIQKEDGSQVNEPMEHFYWAD